MVHFSRHLGTVFPIFIELQTEPYKCLTRKITNNHSILRNTFNLLIMGVLFNHYIVFVAQNM